MIIVPDSNDDSAQDCEHNEYRNHWIGCLLFRRWCSGCSRFGSCLFNVVDIQCERTLCDFHHGRKISNAVRSGHAIFHVDTIDADEEVSNSAPKNKQRRNNIRDRQNGDTQEMQRKKIPTQLQTHTRKNTGIHARFGGV